MTPNAINTEWVQGHQQFVVAHAAEQGMTPDAFAEKYRDVLHEQEGKEFSPAQFYADALSKKIADDPAGAIREYNRLDTKGGHELNADEARELSEFYRADRTRAGGRASARRQIYTKAI